jgi:hypothetical protein
MLVCTSRDVVRDAPERARVRVGRGGRDRHAADERHARRERAERVAKARLLLAPMGVTDAALEACIDACLTRVGEAPR